MDQAAMIDKALSNPEFNYVNIDILWTEVVKYMPSSPEATEKCAALLNHHSDRFLMVTDEVVPRDQASYLKIIYMYEPLLDKLTPDTREKNMLNKRQICVNLRHQRENFSKLIKFPVI